MSKDHLINKAEFTWEKLPSGLFGLHENGVYLGLIKMTTEYSTHDIEFYSNNGYSMDDAMLSLEDYAISLGLNVYLCDSGFSTPTQQWSTYIIK